MRRQVASDHMLPQHISVTACKIYKSRLRTTNVRNGHSFLKHRSVNTRATMGYQLFNVFWNSACGADPSNDPNGRVKRLADVNTHIGGGTWNDPPDLHPDQHTRANCGLDVRLNGSTCRAGCCRLVPLPPPAEECEAHHRPNMLGMKI